LKVDACRLFLEGLASSGVIELPSKQAKAKWSSGPKAEPLPPTFLEGPLKRFRPVTVDQ
jgi:hypothetical protein